MHLGQQTGLCLTTDLLLEELALNVTSSNNVQDGSNKDRADRDATASEGHALKERTSSTSVYSDLPPPVQAFLDPDSPTQELESVLQDLMGLAQGDPGPSTIPPPLTQKKSVKKETEDGRRKKEDTGGSTGPTAKDTIDELLGGLSSDLEKIGVRTNPKGHCAACHKCIVGKMITALGEVWHPEHFVCAVCTQELSTTGFFERDGKPYCHKDYHEMFSPRCAYCKGPIMQNILTALDETWHPDHFFCTHCGELFGPDGFLEKDGKPYCSKDFYHLFAPKCSGCGEPVREDYLTAANGTWHSECFVCADCLKPFTNGCFMELDGRPLCSLHFYSRQGTLCGGCGEPVIGRCISALDRKFHPEHFVCAFCLRQLSQGIFREQKGKPYCSSCFGKLFV
uniref:Leupaxin n=1 Tax=Oryzias sinensis TaxID=183150 RepID=A0A8C7YQU2_9TELE